MPAATAGRAPGASTTPKASSTASSTWSAATRRPSDSYSYAAGEVILPHVLGPFQEVLLETTSWPVIAEHGGLVVAFGGLPLRNAQVSSGGTGAHVQRDALAGLPRRRASTSSRSGPMQRRCRGLAGGRMARRPAQHRCRADAGPGPHAACRGPARPRLPGALLRRLRALRALPDRCWSTARPRTPTGLPRSPRFRPTRSARLPGAWLRARTMIALSWSLTAWRPRRAALLDGRRRWPPCWARSVCRAAVSASAIGVNSIGS